MEGSKNDLVKLNVGGVPFWTWSSTLRTFPSTRLGRLSYNSPNYIKELDCFFFDRNSMVFHYVLESYRTGKLHFPANGMCCASVEDEMAFWGLDPKSVLAPCCVGTYQEFEDKRSTMDRVCAESMAEKERELDIRKHLRNKRGLKRRRYELWLFLEHPNSSTAAQVSSNS